MSSVGSFFLYVNDARSHEPEAILVKLEEKIKTYMLCLITFSENCAVYEMMWNNIVEWGRAHMTV